jgi:hypothetical protein
LEAKGQAVDFKELLRMEPDRGTIDIRNVKSKQLDTLAEVREVLESIGDTCPECPPE